MIRRHQINQLIAATLSANSLLLTNSSPHTSMRKVILTRWKADFQQEPCLQKRNVSRLQIETRTANCAMTLQGIFFGAGESEIPGQT